jgi:type VI secretion system protein ImpF
MAAQSSDRVVRHSVLDRLLDGAGTVGDATVTWAESVRQLKRALLRDLEWLLNTRRIAEPAPDSYPEVQRSVYHYGLPDISSMSLDPETVKRRLVAYVEECLELFEPRLTAVRVTPVEQETEDRTVRFKIEALLRMDPSPERIVFDTVLEPARGEFQVTGDEYA